MAAFLGAPQAEERSRLGLTMFRLAQWVKSPRP